MSNSSRPVGSPGVPHKGEPFFYFTCWIPPLDRSFFPQRCPAISRKFMTDLKSTTPYIFFLSKGIESLRKAKKQGGGGFRELYSNSGDLGEVSGFPLRTCGPAHHLCTRPRCPSLFLSPKPPLTYQLTLFWHWSSFTPAGGPRHRGLFCPCSIIGQYPMAS